MISSVVVEWQLKSISLLEFSIAGTAVFSSADFNVAEEVKIRGVSYSCQNLRGKWTFSQKSCMLMYISGFVWVSLSSLLLSLFYTVNVVWADFLPILVNFHNDCARLNKYNYRLLKAPFQVRHWNSVSPNVHTVRRGLGWKWSQEHPRLKLMGVRPVILVPVLVTWGTLWTSINNKLLS